MKPAFDNLVAVQIPKTNQNFIVEFITDWTRFLKEMPLKLNDGLVGTLFTVFPDHF